MAHSRENGSELPSGYLNGEEPEEDAFQILGHPWTYLQGDLGYFCEFLAQGLQPYSQGFDWATESERCGAEAASGWTLLLQLPNSIEANLEWINASALNFMIRREELARGNFSTIVIDMQQ